MKYFLIACLLVLNIYLLLIVKTCKNKEEELAQENIELNNSNERIISSLNDGSGTNFTSLNSCDYVFKVNGDSVLIKNIFARKTLVLAYSQFSCGVCVSSEIQLLKKFQKQHPNLSIIILGNTDKFVHVNSFTRVNELEIPIYCIRRDLPVKAFGLSGNKMFYFVTNKDLSVTNIFIPIKNNISPTESYFYSLMNNVL